MKTIRYLLTAIMLYIGFTGLNAQDPNDKFSEAEKAYAAKNLDNTRFALQEALAEINRAIGRDILVILPKKLSDITFNEKDDNMTGAPGFAGLFVSRNYGSGDKSGSIEVMSDSPLLTALNALLSLPAMMATADPNQKRVKINGYKSLLTKETDADGAMSFNLQIPINQTLVTLKVKGIPDENKVVALGNSLPLDQIAKLAN